MNTVSRSTLSRPRSGRMLGGVCAGLARRFGWQTSTVRILAVASCLLPGPQFVAYIALWIIMPNDKY
ncbi:PspC domain-containing protein [Saccharomonospora sp. CUA-673]|uniref:PspC domain-containing protein n=1 Tax=Saccharomonospora sp. CUA-673 TaxID=1904969 RepID=UPI000961DA05|nr:PspC domain-containing protein [Saccharomonospora sp. CUA-673]OLT43094.1 PspC domain-containing protein [Saccharomonospora sp. CUA-673]